MQTAKTQILRYAIFISLLPKHHYLEHMHVKRANKINPRPRLNNTQLRKNVTKLINANAVITKRGTANTCKL